MPRGFQADIATVQRALQAASDDHLTKIVAVLDGMQGRGETDALIAGLRPRLTKLKPARPLRLTRLLFIPLESLLLSDTEWRPSKKGIPRAALTPVADIVASAIPASVLRLRRRVAGATTGQGKIVAEIGAWLWPQAASALRSALDAGATPDGWTASGLRSADFDSLLRGIAGALAHAAPAQRLASRMRAGGQPSIAELDAILDGAEAGGPEAADTTIAMLIGVLPDPTQALDRIMSRASADGRARRSRAESTINSVLSRSANKAAIEEAIGKADLRSAAFQVQRLSLLLACLDQPRAPRERRDCLIALRMAADAACRRRVAASLESDVLGGSAGNAAPDQASTESAARALHMMVSAARSIGSAPIYDSLVNDAADRLSARAPLPGCSQADTLRLIEIIAGSDRASLGLLYQPAEMMTLGSVQQARSGRRPEPRQGPASLDPLDEG